MDIKSILDPKQAVFDSKVAVSSRMMDASLMPGSIVVTKQSCFYVFLRGTDYSKEGLFIRLNKLPEKSMFHTKVMEYSNPLLRWKEPYYYDINRGIISLDNNKIKAMIHLGGTHLDKLEFQRMMLLIQSYLLGEYVLDKDGKFLPAPFSSNPAVRAIYMRRYDNTASYTPFVVRVPMAVKMDGLPFEPVENPPEYDFKYDYPNHPYNDFIQVFTGGTHKGSTCNDIIADFYSDWLKQQTQTTDSNDSTTAPAPEVPSSQVAETDNPAPKKTVAKKQPKKERAKRNPRKFLTFHNVYSLETDNRVDAIFDAFKDFLIDGKLPVRIAYTYLSRDNMEYPSKPRPQSFAVTKDEFKAILNMDVTEIKNKFNYSSSVASDIRRSVKFIFNGYHDTPGRGSKIDEKYIKYIESQIKLNRPKRDIIDGLERTFKEDAGRVDFAAIYNKFYTRDIKKSYKSKESIDDRILNFIDTAFVSKYRKKDQLLSILISLKDKFPSIVDGAESFDSHNTILDIMTLYCIYRIYDYRTAYNLIFNEKFKPQLDAYAKLKIPEIMDAFNLNTSKKGCKDPVVFKVSFLVTIKYLLWIKNLDSAQKRPIKNAFTNPDSKKGFDSLPMVMKAFLGTNSISLNTKQFVSDMLGIELEEFNRMRNYANKLDSSYRNVYLSEALHQLS